MQAPTKNPALTVPGALETARCLGAFGTPAGIPETAPYVQRFAGVFGGEG